MQQQVAIRVGIYLTIGFVNWVTDPLFDEKENSLRRVFGAECGGVQHTGQVTQTHKQAGVCSFGVLMNSVVVMPGMDETGGDI